MSGSLTQFKAVCSGQTFHSGDVANRSSIHGERGCNSCQEPLCVSHFGYLASGGRPTNSRLLCLCVQLDYSTALVLVDIEDAPFGLERLDRIEALFRDDLQSLQSMFESAINGSRPLRLTNGSRRAKRTEVHVQGVIEYLVERIRDLENSADDSLVLSLGPDGAILVEVLPASVTETLALTKDTLQGPVPLLLLVTPARSLAAERMKSSTLRSSGGENNGEESARSRLVARN